MEEQTAIRILKTIAQTRLRPAASEPIPEQSAAGALSEAFGTASRTTPSEGELAEAALDLLSHDPNFAEPIRLMTAQANSAPNAQRYVESSTITLSTAVLLVLQARIKFKADVSGKWSVEIEKKSAGDATLELVVQRLLSFLRK